MRRLVTVLFWVAFAVAILAIPAAKLAASAFGRDATRLQSVNDETQVEVRRATFDDTGLSPEERRTQVIEIYGATSAKTAERYLFVGDGDVIVPAEDPSLTLLRPAGEGAYLVQAKSVDFAARRVALGAALAFVVLLAIRSLVFGRGH